MSCSYVESGRGATTSGSVAIKSGSENDLQSAVANIGPIAVAVDAQSNAFRVSLLPISTIYTGAEVHIKSFSNILENITKILP